MTRSHNDLTPAIPVHPGEILKEALEEHGMTQRALAEKVGRPVQLINSIVNGHKGITADTALDLADAFGTSAEFWLNLDSYYRLNLARRKRQESRERKVG